MKTNDPFRRARVPDTGPTELLTTFENYLDAQAAVDKLSDEGFPVDTVSIVWNRLRQVEYVTGRRTVLSALAEGAVSGLWFGGFLGLLLTFFVELDEDVSALGVVISYALLGAIVVAVWRAISHWMSRGRRDFSTIGKLEAESYDIWVSATERARAAAIIGV